MGTQQRAAAGARPDAVRPTGAATMRAMAQDVYGEADVLRLEEIDQPEPGDNEVLLRVYAAGVDRGSGTSWRARPT